MRRATLDALTEAAGPMARALAPDTGEERLVDPVRDTSPLGLAAAAALRQGVSGEAVVEGQRWFISLYDAPWEIVLVGAVHIAQALAALAASAGFSVRVIDPRAAYVTAERFAGVPLTVDWPDTALARARLTRRSALVVLAHDPKIDDAALAAGLRSPAFYIGALGSSRTQARRLARLEQQGFHPAMLTRIHGPVGLAIGARTPMEIAIAVLAQVVQVRRRPAARIGGIVLAAGLSRRMGGNKLLAEVAGKSMLRQVVETALASRLDNVLVVTGHEADAAAEVLRGLLVTLVHNPDFALGLSSSLQTGIAAVPQDCEGALILLGDMPGITPPVIDQTIAAFDPAQGRAICVATANSKRGHPVLWGRQYFAQIQSLTGDAGARGLMMTHADAVVEVETGNPAVLTDIDTPEALAAYRG